MRLGRLETVRFDCNPVWKAVKGALRRLSLAIVMPLAALTGFGRFPTLFQFCAQSFALIPGRLGDYLRIAFYHLTLDRCSLHSRVSFGSFFAHSSSVVSAGVYIGVYCVLGTCEIGERTQIASDVQILAGRHQHARTADGRILGATEDSFTRIVIGDDCWIGAGAIVMADVGQKTTIGAGAVVTRPIPPRTVAVGNPARAVERPASQLTRARRTQVEARLASRE